MADAFYVEYRNAILGAWTHSFPDLNTDNLKVGLRDEGTTALNLTTQVDHADISSALVATSSNLTGPTVGSVAAGTFDHDNITWSSVSGASVESLDYYKDSGVSSTSPLIANIDSATGLPVTPNGGDITYTVNASGAWQIQ
jgi:hypothetical protein